VGAIRTRRSVTTDKMAAAAAAAAAATLGALPQRCSDSDADSHSTSITQWLTSVCVNFFRFKLSKGISVSTGPI